MTLLHEKTSSSSIYLVLIALFLIAFFLRSYLLWQNLFFGPEQGKDFLVIRDIVINHKLTLLGPKTDIEGVFHGPFYYYLTVIPFLIGKGNPLFVILFYVFFNSLTIFFIYLLGKELFDQRVGLFSALLFTISFSSLVYARWLSNPPLSIPLSCLFFLFLHRFFERKKIYLIFAAVVFGLLVQVQFLNLLFFSSITLILTLLNYRLVKMINKVYLFVCLLTLFFLSIGTFILFDLRHKFLIIHSLWNLFTGSSGYYVSILDSLKAGFNTFVSSFFYTIIPSSFLIGVFLVVITIIFLVLRMIESKKDSYALIFVWLIVPILILIVIRHSILEHYFIPLLTGLIIGIAAMIDEIEKKLKLVGVLLLGILIISNFFTWQSNILRNKNIFFQSTQLGLKFSDQLKVIDDIYKSAKMGPFSFQAYTIPYWSQQGWEYLFWYYGYQRYGYSPVEEKAPRLYVIIQEDPSNKQFQKKWLEDIVSKWGKQERTFRHGILEVKELSTKWSYENSQ